MPVQGALANLRRSIRSIEGAAAAPPRATAAVALGFADIDARFEGGGLPPGAHQAAGAEGDPLAAWSFGCTLVCRVLAGREGGRALMVQESSAVREAGKPYAPGLLAFGLDPDRLAFVEVRHGAEALRVANEALKSRAVAVVLVELCDGAILADLSVTRRFNLAARRAGALAIVITPTLEGTSAALTRWRVTPAPTAGPRRRLGAPAFDLALIRNRLGPTGAWTVEWDCHDRRFRSPAPLPASVARPLVDRPDTPGRLVPAASARNAPGAYRQTG